MEKSDITSAKNGGVLNGVRHLYGGWGLNKEIEMFSVYFFVIFFANFCANFCIEYFSAIFCVKKRDFFAQCKIFHPKMGKISQKNLQ